MLMVLDQDFVKQRDGGKDPFKGIGYTCKPLLECALVMILPLRGYGKIVKALVAPREGTRHILNTSSHFLSPDITLAPM